jgi:hypothetical protein
MTSPPPEIAGRYDIVRLCLVCAILSVFDARVFGFQPSAKISEGEIMLPRIANRKNNPPYVTHFIDASLLFPC